MATGTTNLAALPKDPNAIASTTNPVGNGMLNYKAVDPSQEAMKSGAKGTIVTTNTGATTGPVTPPADAGANSPAATYDPTLGTAGQTTATGYQATPYEVAPGGLVENRIKDIVKGNSPLMQQAEQLALARSNDRGMLNSSIGTAAGQSAVIAAAAPIATSDAGSINAAMTNTANAQNAASQFNTGEVNKANELNANLTSQMNAINANASNAALNLEAQAQNAQIMSRLDQQQKLQMQQVLNANQMLLNQNSAAAQLAQQTMTNIANIQMSTTLDAAAKATAIAGQMNLMNESLRATQVIATNAPGQISSLGIADLFGGGTSTPQDPGGTTTGGTTTGGTTTGGTTTGGVTDLFGGGNATSGNVVGSKATKKAATLDEAKANEATLREEATSLEAQRAAALAKRVPAGRGAKATNAPFNEQAAEFRRQSIVASQAADAALVQGIRFKTPDQYNARVSAYETNLAISKATNNAAGVERYTRLLSGLKAPGFPKAPPAPILPTAGGTTAATQAAAAATAQKLATANTAFTSSQTNLATIKAQEAALYSTLWATQRGGKAHNAPINANILALRALATSTKEASTKAQVEVWRNSNSAVYQAAVDSYTDKVALATTPAEKAALTKTLAALTAAGGPKPTPVPQYTTAPAMATALTAAKGAGATASVALSTASAANKAANDAVAAAQAKVTAAANAARPVFNGVQGSGGNISPPAAVAAFKAASNELVAAQRAASKTYAAYSTALAASHTARALVQGLQLQNINKFYTPAQKTSLKASYTTQIAAQNALPKTATTLSAIRFMTTMLKGIK